MWQSVKLLGLDIDGTLTDGFLYWAGPDVGFTQRFAVRDGEAIVRLRKKELPIVPISRNKTACAKVRMQMLGLPLEWVGVDDKELALRQVCARYALDAQAICYVGDGREDAPILSSVGMGVCVADGHKKTLAAARYTTQAGGGCGAAEEVIEHIMAARGWLD
jgi:3-deoxy-D-manno-octulosonate 8-phosphate phosphatase (KDO 8-P phosphatase)